MSKIKTFFRVIKRILLKPGTLRNVLADDKGYQTYIEKKYNLNQLKTVDLLDLIGPFVETIQNYTYLEGTSLPIDLVLLKALAKKFDNCTYFEIGSWRGESLYNVAQVAKHCTSLSLSEEEQRKMKFPEEIIRLNHLFSKSLPNVEYIHHNSLTFDFRSHGKKYDLIFIDGDHAYKAVAKDTANAFNHLTNENSIIVWHDYGRTVEKVRHEVLAGILDGAPKGAWNKIFHVSNTMCAVYLPKASETTYWTRFPSTPNKTFQITISGKRIDG